MKPLSVLLFLLAIAAAGCEKPSDLAALAEEATGLVKAYRPRIAELERRAADLNQRGLALQVSEAEALPARELFGDAQKWIAELKGGQDGMLAQIAAAEKAGKPEDLSRLLHRVRTQLAEGRLAINGNLDAVEAWLFHQERRPRLQQATPPPAAPPTPPPVTPEKAAEPGSAPAPTH